MIAIPLIMTQLTAAEQVFYYAFASLAALQIFIELGMTGVVVQSLAHEVAHLELKTVSEPEWSGLMYNKSRLSSIVRFSAWWFGGAGICTSVALAIGGYWFLDTVEAKHASGVSWSAPWLFIAFISGWVVVTAGVMAILDGLGFIGSTTKIRFIASVAGLFALVGALLCGAGLWAVPINLATSVIITLLGGIWYLRAPLRAVVNQPPDASYSWSKEIWPYQWRIALSWMAGWILFQAMTPAILRIAGAEAAGRFGLAFQIANGVQAIAMVWTQIRSPAWGMLVAKENWDELDCDFRRSVTISLISCLLGVGMVLMCITWLKSSQVAFHERLPDLLTIIPLMGVAVLNQWVMGVALYLRAHRREPFLIISVGSGILMLCLLQFSSIIQAGLLPLIYFLIMIVVGGICGTAIWCRCRTLWHSAHKTVNA
jgi:hypothetical protein